MALCSTLVRDIMIKKVFLLGLWRAATEKNSTTSSIFKKRTTTKKIAKKTVRREQALQLLTRCPALGTHRTTYI